MDNKRWYKRISTCFWFLFATFPLWICVLSSCFTMIGLQGTDLSNKSIEVVFSNTFDQTYQHLFFDLDWISCIPTFIQNMFNQLCETIIGVDYYDFISVFMSWFVWVYFIELMVDFIVWLPRWFHRIMEKGMDKLS